MLEFLSDILPVGPLAALGLFVGAWLGWHVASGWTGLLVGAGLGFAFGIWLDNTKNPSLTALRRYAYAALIAAGIILALRHWLSGH